MTKKQADFLVFFICFWLISPTAHASSVAPIAGLIFMGIGFTIVAAALVFKCMMYRSILRSGGEAKKTGGATGWSLLIVQYLVLFLFVFLEGHVIAETPKFIFMDEVLYWLIPIGITVVLKNAHRRLFQSCHRQGSYRNESAHQKTRS